MTPSSPAEAATLATACVDARRGDATTPFEEQILGSQRCWSQSDPVIEERLELGVQRDVAVGVEFADRDVQPIRRADLNDRVDGEVDQFTFAHSGSGQELNGETNEWVGVGSGGDEQFGGSGVVEEAWQRLIEDRRVAGEHQDPSGDVIAAPFTEPFEAGSQRAHMSSDRHFRQCPAATRRSDSGTGGQVRLVGLDVCAGDVRDAGHVGIVIVQEHRELAQHRLDANDRGWAQRHRDLVQVAEQGARQLGCDLRPLRCAFGGFVVSGLDRWIVDDAEMEQGCLDPEHVFGHHRRGAFGIAATVRQRRRDEHLAAGDELAGRDLIGARLMDDSDFHQGRPLQLHRFGSETEISGDTAELGEELDVMATRDVTNVQSGSDEIVGGRRQPAGDHQPADHPPVLVRLGALVGQTQLIPPIDTDTREERARHRDRRPSSEHARSTHRVLINRHQIFGRFRCRRRRHAHSATVCASIASAARMYSPASQSLAK